MEGVSRLYKEECMWAHFSVQERFAQGGSFLLAFKLEKDFLSGKGMVLCGGKSAFEGSGWKKHGAF